MMKRECTYFLTMFRLNMQELDLIFFACLSDLIY